MADEMNLRRPQLIKKIEIVHGEVGDIPDPRRIVGRAEAGMFRNQDLVPLRQFFEQRQPGRKPARPVQKDQRLTFAAAQQAHHNVAHAMF